MKSLRLVTFVILVAATAMGCSEGGQSGAAIDATNTATEAPVEHPGKKVYNEFCFSCHAIGLSGAPKFGDIEAWAPRIAKGSALLLQTTIDGIPPAMPPRGICMACTDEELAEVVDYMVVNAQ
ncbi:MAG: cytochrome c5 [Limisphaerales bacterium]